MTLYDTDYTLDDELGNVWIEVGALVVRIVRADDGVRVEVYPADDASGEPLATCEARGAE